LALTCLTYANSNEDTFPLDLAQIGPWFSPSTFWNPGDSDPEPTAITDAYGNVKNNATEIDNLDLGLKLVVNRVKSVTEGRRVAERVINIAGQFLNLKIDYLGFVYDDALVHTAVVKQKPFMALDPKSKASICVDHIARRLENMDFKEGGGVSKFIRKFFGAQA
jgi:flagellar biosynthesis protein FlhG